ncbi:hypothetical protein HAX54_044927 [Datura stramonium]|uniref:Uncharacterized protein n=1 Tax=Datura stramonium TaxID=4076 RepID=A0ABS8SPY8_DATST|nr:hypothetical protein [Datura stramonium]
MLVYTNSILIIANGYSFSLAKIASFFVCQSRKDVEGSLFVVKRFKGVQVTFKNPLSSKPDFQFVSRDSNEVVSFAGENGLVKIVEDGFLGSLHLGTVIGCDDIFRQVKYDHILSDHGSDNLVEFVSVSPIVDWVTPADEKPVHHLVVALEDKLNLETYFDDLNALCTDSAATLPDDQLCGSGDCRSIPPRQNEESSVSPHDYSVIPPPVVDDTGILSSTKSDLPALANSKPR